MAPADPYSPDRLTPLLRRYGLPAKAARPIQTLWERLSSDERTPSAVREPGAVLDRHIADSLAGLEVPQVRGARRIADLGAGAGLPGLVLAAALPAAEVSAVESQRRKCSYIEELAAVAALENVRTVPQRAEEWREGLGAADLIVARALASQAVVLEYAAPLLAIGGHVVEWRGRRDDREERAGEIAAGELGLERLEIRRVQPFADATDRHLHVFAKTAPTPPRFPRRPGVARRRPLGA